MENCPVCGQALREGVCPSCGYDLSADYVRWPTFQWIPSVERPPDPEKERPDPFRRVLSLLHRRRAPSPEQVSVPLDRDAPLLPILLTVLMGNVLLSFSLYFPSGNVRPLIFGIFLSAGDRLARGMFVGLLVYLCLHCARRTVLLTIPAMLAGLQMGAQLARLSSPKISFLYYFWDEFLLQPVFTHEGFSLFWACLACSLLSFFLARHDWAWWKSCVCAMGCSVAAWMLSNALLCSITGANFSWHLYPPMLFSYLVHVLAACPILSSLAYSAATRELPQRKQYASLAICTAVVFYCTAVCYFTYHFDHSNEAFFFTIPRLLNQHFFSEVGACVVCLFAGQFAGRRGWPKWSQYLIAAVSFLLAAQGFTFVYQTWLSDWLASWGLILREGRLF